MESWNPLVDLLFMNPESLLNMCCLCRVPGGARHSQVSNRKVNDVNGGLLMVDLAAIIQPCPTSFFCRWVKTHSPTKMD